MFEFILLFLLILPQNTSYKLNPDWLKWKGCISHHEALQLLHLKDMHQTHLPQNVLASVDLGLSKQLIQIDREGISMGTPKGDLLATWDELNDIAEKKSGCYSLYDDGSQPTKVNTISPNTNIPASLCPPLSESGAPTMVLGGFTMHRIAGDAMNPMIDTTNKISSVGINEKNRVLDTCMGLGYTAIAAGKLVKSDGQVITIEYDEASLEIAAHNPWSKGLFDGSLPITVEHGDSCKIIRRFDDGYFNVVIHDPPAKALCRTELYSAEFYSELHRILRKPSGKLFHYIGNPSSKESGRLYRGIIDRLIEVGFRNVKKDARAFGVTASV